MTVRAEKPEITLRREPSTSDGAAGTTMAGALMGGTIGAYAGGPFGAIAGVVIGGAAGAVYGITVDRYSGKLHSVMDSRPQETAGSKHT